MPYAVSKMLIALTKMEVDACAWNHLVNGMFGAGLVDWESTSVSSR